MVFDAETNLLYMKFEGSDFPVQSFVDWSQVGSGKNIFVANATWQTSRIRAYQKSKNVINIWKQADRYSLEDVQSAGAVVYDESGRCIGFVDKDGFVQSASKVQRSFASVVEKQQVEPALHAWFGEFVDGYIDPMSGLLIEKSGFLIGKVEAADTLLKAGDIIVQVNGKGIDPVSFARVLQSLSEPYTLGILRNSETLEVSVDSAKKN